MKAISALVLVLLFCGCGVKVSDQFVIGSTGFLQEVNKRRPVVTVSAEREQVARRDER